MRIFSRLADSLVQPDALDLTIKDRISFSPGKKSLKERRPVKKKPKRKSLVAIF